MDYVKTHPFTVQIPVHKFESKFDPKEGIEGGFVQMNNSEFIYLWHAWDLFYHACRDVLLSQQR